MNEDIIKPKNLSTPDPKSLLEKPKFISKLEKYMILSAVTFFQEDWKEIEKFFYLKDFDRIKLIYNDIKSKWNSETFTDKENSKLCQPIRKNLQINFIERSVVLETKSPHYCKNQWKKINQINPRIYSDFEPEEQTLMAQLLKKTDGQWNLMQNHFFLRTDHDLEFFFQSMIIQIKTNESFISLFKMLTPFSPWFKLIVESNCVKKR